jgi:hypothetical protein
VSAIAVTGASLFLEAGNSTEPVSKGGFMVNESAIYSRPGHWINWLSRSSQVKPKRSRTYDYSRALDGVDYMFDSLSAGSGRGHMTSQRSGVKVGDHILLAQDGVTQKYEVQAIDYYSSPEDMWVALLTKLNG